MAQLLVPVTAPGPAHSRLRLAERVRRAGRVARAVVEAGIRPVRMVPAERWFWLGMVLLLALYVVILVVQPTAAGRGGR
jgi:hypothetical protein